MYFSKFPSFLAQIGATQKIVEDFFIRVSAGKNYTTSSVLLIDYFVKDGERIEDIAYNFYGNSEYHWVLLLVNMITDPRNDWPLRDADVYTMTRLKYGNTDSIHHYRTVVGHHEISAYANLIANGTIESVSNYNHELVLNDAKRKIKILDAQYLQEFVSDFSQRVKL